MQPTANIERLAERRAIDWPDRRPLVAVSVCEALLDRLPEEIMAEIEDGRLAWAWHFEGLDAARRCVRVWRQCVVNRLAGAPQPLMAEDQVLAAILPGSREAFTVQELRRRLAISGGHIMHLISDGLLRVENGTPWRSGAGGSPRVMRSSAVQFMRARRMQ